MRLLRIISVILITVLVIGSAFAYRQHTYRPTSESKSICETCFVNQPVGDVIIPQLALGAGGGVENKALNMSQGENVTLGVDVYLTITANVSLTFKIQMSSASSTLSPEPVGASFSPQSFEAIENENASALMTILVSKNAPVGTYSTVVVVTDLENMSITWGTLLEINVD